MASKKGYKYNGEAHRPYPIQSTTPGDFQALEAILTENPADLLSDDAVTVLDPLDMVDLKESAVELGIWFSGIHSYLGSRPHISSGIENPAWEHLAAAEFRILHAGIKNCILLISLICSDKDAVAEITGQTNDRLSGGDLRDLHELLTEAMMIGGSLINSSVQGPGQWREWTNTLGRRLGASEAFFEIIRLAEESGKRFLPDHLRGIVADPNSSTLEKAEIALLLPRFGIILKWLSIVKKMLDADVALKPSLLIFVRVNELVLELTSYISNRLDKFPDQDAELFASLDAAAYTASIELKKVHSQELAGVGSMRPPPSIYARVETAYSLLNDGFQQILGGFMRMLDPDVETLDLFPDFQTKLRHSIALRAELWSTCQIVKDAERTPDAARIEELRRSLMNFRRVSMHYLFYKDTETVERFIEEILVTNQNKDLVPILHRFGAFLETLFGQVTLRAVLEKHPFERRRE